MTLGWIEDAVSSIRKRPGMYVGGTDARGLLQLVREVVSNSIDQFLAGRATYVRVDTTESTIKVTDDGEGMPFDQLTPDSSENLATLYLTSMHHSGSADGHAPHMHFSGLRGLGVVASNALSAEFCCQSFRDGSLWHQSFVRGIPVEAARPSKSAEGRGTIVTFRPDPEIFGETRICIESLRADAFEAVHLFPGLRFEINQEAFCAPNGLGSLIHIHNNHNDVQWYRWKDRPVFVVNAVFEDVQISAAAIGFADTKTEWKTWSNGVQTYQGGSHQSGFTDALRGVRWKPATALLHTVMHNPSYAGPTRGQLDVPHIRKLVSTSLGTELKLYCQQHSLGRYSTRDS